MRLRTGDAYWIDAFPPLDGGEPKRRPAVFLDLGDAIPDSPDGLLVFVGTTTDNDRDMHRDHDAIHAPVGLPTPCVILPRWVAEVPRSAVGPAAGRLGAPLIAKLLDAVIDRFFDLPSGESP